VGRRRSATAPRPTRVPRSLLRGRERARRPRHDP
jgi:hypothetical protein